MIVIETDDRLIGRLKRGDKEAFEALFVRHYAQVYRVLYGLLSSREMSEDLAQETFMELYRRPPVSTENGTVIAWLCRVALNRGYNALRGEKRAQQRLERFAASHDADDPYTDLVRAEERAVVRDVLAHLPERQSRMLLLRHAGLSLAEIAAAVEVAPGSVGTMLARAEKAFASAYQLMRPVEPGAGSNPEKRNI